METVTKNRMLICDVHGNVVATNAASVLHGTIEFAHDYLGIDLESIQIGEKNGAILSGLIPTSECDRIPTTAEQAAIGAFVKCLDENAEYRAHQQIQNSIQHIGEQLSVIDSQTKMLIHFMEAQPATNGAEMPTPSARKPTLGRGLEALIPAKLTVTGQKSSTKRSK